MSRPPLSEAERARLLRIAKTIESEAETWADGFAVRDGKELIWSKAEEWAHVRWFKLVKAAEFLRQLAYRGGPSTTLQ